MLTETERHLPHTPAATVDLLVRQAQALLEDAHRDAVTTLRGHNIDLLTQAIEACAAWLGR
jgi:hypothetical protein